MIGDLPVIPVLFGSDRNYLQHTAVCIASLAENNPDFKFDILLVSGEDLSPLSEKLLGSCQKWPNIDLRIVRFALPPDMHFPVHFHYTQETYFRFWIGEFFAGYDRALYLDPDIVITSSIKELWNTDLGGLTLGAVPIPGSVRPSQHGMPPGSLFFNAGVLLFDLASWRRHDYQNMCLRYLNDHPERAIDSDQDILNLCLMGDWLPLPFRWNVISAFYFPWHDLQLPEGEVDEICRAACVIHFNGGMKPWSYTSRHPRKVEYWKYLRLTAWRNVGATDRTIVNIAKRQVRNILNLRQAGKKR